MDIITKCAVFVLVILLMGAVSWYIKAYPCKAITNLVDQAIEINKSDKALLQRMNGSRDGTQNPLRGTTSPVAERYGTCLSNDTRTPLKSLEHTVEPQEENS